MQIWNFLVSKIRISKICIYISQNNSYWNYIYSTLGLQFQRYRIYIYIYLFKQLSLTVWTQSLPFKLKIYFKNKWNELLLNPFVTYSFRNVTTVWQICLPCHTHPSGVYIWFIVPVYTYFCMQIAGNQSHHFTNDTKRLCCQCCIVYT